MNAREQARFDMIKRVGTFGTNNSTNFTTAVPPLAEVTPGQAQAAQLFQDLNAPKGGLIARIGKNAENQQTGTGTARGGTTSKTVLRDALFLELKGINRTAAAIAGAQDKPEIMDKFRMASGTPCLSRRRTPLPMPRSHWPPISSRMDTRRRSSPICARTLQRLERPTLRKIPARKLKPARPKVSVRSWLKR
jgi:hypothetical protein